MEHKKKLGALTLGCRVNQYETQACCEIFESFGYTVSEPSEDCGAFFVNTCSVTLESDRKSRQMIARLVRLARPSGAPVLVCGCHVQAHPDEVFGYDRVFFCGNSDKSAFVRSFLEGAAASAPVYSRKEMDRFFPSSVSSSKNTRAFVKIEDGCDNFCSYCIVARLRGPVRSRPAAEVVEDVRRLAANGFREIVLTGIETSFYGRDLGGDDLVTLSERVSRIEGVERIRFGSLRPTLFTRDFCRRLSGAGKVMPHFHLSVQSGSDRVLSLMRRGYGRGDVLRAFENVREFFPDAAFSADVICGFPGETEEDFLSSVSLVDEGRFIHTHVFPYSERPGTLAATMPDSVPVAVRRERAARLAGKAGDIAASFISDHAGAVMTILAEKVGRRIVGHTENFISVRLPAAPDVSQGDFVRVVLSGECETVRGSLFAAARIKEN